MRRRTTRRKQRNAISSKQLKNFILKEARKLQREAALSGKLDPIEKVKADEYEAGEEAQQLEKDIDHIKALKIHESKLKFRMKKIQEAKKKLRRRIVKKL